MKQYYENSEYRTAIKRSQINVEAMNLVNQHYKYLYNTLVKSEGDKDIFQDTVLSISYKYNPDKEFTEQFIFHFKSNQYGLLQESKMRNYIIRVNPDKYYFKTEEEYLEPNKSSLDEFTANILQDARNKITTKN